MLNLIYSFEHARTAYLIWDVLFHYWRKCDFWCVAMLLGTNICPYDVVIKKTVCSDTSPPWSSFFKVPLTPFRVRCQEPHISHQLAALWFCVLITSSSTRWCGFSTRHSLRDSCSSQKESTEINCRMPPTSKHKGSVLLCFKHWPELTQRAIHYASCWCIRRSCSRVM